MRILILGILLGLLSALSAQAQLDHGNWDQLLKAHVGANGVVDYKALKSKKAVIDDYVRYLGDNMPDQSQRNRDEAMAYWINLYNAATVQLILDNYPIKSIMNLDKGKTWDVPRVKVGSELLSLNDIEHKKLRPVFKDARIHFAVNCAAKSCPKLWNRAWTAKNIDSQLDVMTKAFVNNTTSNTIKSKSIKLSKIFEWYASDFGDLIEFLNRYSSAKISKSTKVAYIEYDWALNGK